MCGFPSIGSILCPQAALVPQVTSFTAQVILFDIDIPVTSGSLFELFHHSANLPAVFSRLIAIVDRADGSVIKSNPRCALMPLSITHPVDR
jgi:elongation factor 1 alpha-like protein